MYNLTSAPTIVKGSSTEEAFVQKLIDTSNQQKYEVLGKGSGVEITVSPNSSPEEVLKKFKRIINQTIGEKHQEKLNELEKVHALLIDQLPSLDFKNYESIMAWLIAFAEASLGSPGPFYFDKEIILDTFKENGFIPKDPEKIAFLDAKKGNTALNIIGSVLKEIQERLSISMQLMFVMKKWQNMFCE